jgi:hypothetical protein
LYIGQDFLLLVKNRKTAYLLPKKQIVKSHPLLVKWKKRRGRPNTEFKKHMICLHIQENAATIRLIAMDKDLDLLPTFDVLQLMRQWHIPVEEDEQQISKDELDNGYILIE